MYSFRSVLVGLAFPPLVAAPITLMGVALSSLASPRMPAPDILSWGLLFSLYTVPTAYVATLLVFLPYLRALNRASRPLGMREALIAGGLTGLVASAIWLVLLNGGRGSLEPSGFVFVPALGAAVGVSVAWLLHLVLHSMNAT